VNDTPYYTAHFYTVCQAFAFVNVGGPMGAADTGMAGWLIKCAGWGVCLMGFAGALWSRHNLGSEWRGAPEVRDDHRLITTGPYGFTRHPIYSSLFLMMIGSALTTRYWLSMVEVCVVIAAYTIKAVAEERFLVRRGLWCGFCLSHFFCL
jgi:protein-S-isoprenylcysteine O-methyltransferase Ste14